MVDLWGPGAFGSAGAAATRPPYTPTNGGADPETFFQDCSSPSADDGTEWRSAGLNALLAQLRSVARKSGVPISNLDDNLLTKAIRSHGANYRAAGGTANGLTITLDPAVLDWSELLNVPLWIKASSANTSATVTFSVDGLTPISVKRLGGAALNPGDLQAGFYYQVAYDGTQIQIISSIAPPAGLSTTRAPLLARVDATTTTSVALPTSVDTLVNFQTLNGSSLGTSTWNGTRLTIGAGEGGLWDIRAAWAFFTPTTGIFTACRVRKNGTTVLGESGPPYVQAGGGAIIPTAARLPLVAGDYIEILANHQAGSSQFYYADPRARFSATLLSAT